MDAFEFERLRQQFLSELSESGSPKQKTIILKNFYQTLLNQTDKSLYEAFLTEFLEDFLDCLQKFEVFYCPPEITKEIIWILSKFLEQSILELNFPQITLLIKSLESELKKLIDILSGNKLESTGGKKLYFPLLEKHLKSKDNLLIGTLETLTINIKKNNEKNHFIIVPSFETIDKDLLSQIENSWQISTNYLIKNGKRLSKYHTVIIHFDHHWGNYEGISAGAALTLSFIEELVSFYNASVLISIKDNIAITGGFDEKGSAVTIEDQIIKIKLEMVFYSYIKTFIVPEGNKSNAINQLKKLQKLYPKRELEIVGINNLTDILNRRDLIAIRKQNPVVIATKYARKNWALSLLLLGFLLLTGYFYEIKYDDIPAILQRKGHILFVENKEGKVLFTKSFVDGGDIVNNPWYARNYQMLIDTYKDGKKELLTAGELQSSLQKENKSGSITCYDYKGREIWNYLFQDTISSPGEILSTNYGSNLIDTATINNEKVLIAYSCNAESFGSAIYMLDLKTGKRVLDTFWHPGFIEGGYIIKSKTRNKKNLVFIACNNCWHKAAIGMLDLSDINGKAPADWHHDYYGEKIADLKHYLLFPDEDYQEIITPTISLNMQIGDFNYNEADSSFHCSIYLTYLTGGIDYLVSKDFNSIHIVINDDYARIRDPYVKSGRLKPPLSDTQEYRNLLISQILYWNGKKFVRKEQLK